MTSNHNSNLFYYYDFFYELIIFLIDDIKTYFTRIFFIHPSHCFHTISHRNLAPFASYSLLLLLIYYPRAMLYCEH